MLRNKKIDIEEIKCIAIDNGWDITMERPETRMTRFERGNVAFDFWMSGTVGMFIRKISKHSLEGRSLRPNGYLYEQTQQDIEDILTR